METIESIKIVQDAILDKMGFDISILDISDISTLSEYFIIASANNANQLRAIMEAIQKCLSNIGIKQRHIEGLQGLNWILLDFGHIVVHLFSKEEREYYRLDNIWADAKKINL